MLTQCPSCETTFRLGAADLGAAQGFVECGECGAQFNALESLADEPASAPEHSQPPEPPVPEHEADEIGPAFVLLGSDAAPLPEDPLPEEDAFETTIPENTVIDFEPVAAETEPAASFDASPHNADEEALRTGSPPAAAETEPALVDIRTPETPRGQTLSESDHAILFTDPSAEFDEDEVEETESLDFNDVPAALREEVAALHRPQRTPLYWLWLLLAAALLIGLGLQLVWNLRDHIVSALPDTTPVYAAVCERIACNFEPAGAPNSIELVARDVRDHPQYLDTLLVNATLISRSETASSFPVIQLGLYGQTGEVIGIRRFEPREYLDKSIDRTAGMPPDRPVYIVLEVAGIDSRAVSFEFSFL